MTRDRSASPPPPSNGHRLTDVFVPHCCLAKPLTPLWAAAGTSFCAQTLADLPRRVAPRAAARNFEFGSFVRQIYVRRRRMPSALARLIFYLSLLPSKSDRWRRQRDYGGIFRVKWRALGGTMLSDRFLCPATALLIRAALLNPRSRMLNHVQNPAVNLAAAALP